MAVRKTEFEELRLTPEQIEDIWSDMLDAELNAAYWAALTRKRKICDQWVKGIIAISSCSTMISVLSWSKFWSTLLSIISAVLAALQTVLQLPQDIKTMTELSAKWAMIHCEYEDLLIDAADLSRREALSRHSKLRKEEAGLTKTSVELPKDTKLRDRLFSEICKARNLPDPTEGAKQVEANERRMISA